MWKCYLVYFVDVKLFFFEEVSLFEGRMLEWVRVCVSGIIIDLKVEDVIYSYYVVFWRMVCGVFGVLLVFNGISYFFC